MIARRGRHGCGIAAAGWLLVLAPAAEAHMEVEGAGEIANGALHPLMSPAHALVLLALGLWLGQRRPFELKTPLWAMLPISALALALTASGQVPSLPAPVLSGSALAIAILVGLEIRLPRWAVGMVCALAVAAVGLDSAADADSAYAVTKTLIGSWLSLNAAICYIAICASNAGGRRWAQTAIRVIGSWVIAISLMVLAFALRR
jgi:hydrogenase/urease accessory protein HupE